MDDKDFLQYFEQIKTENKHNLIANSEKILKTIIATQHLQKDEFKSTFGKQVSEDIDFTLKKLIGGILSTTPSIQKNYSLVLSQILSKFSNSISCKEFISYLVEQSNKKNALNKAENNHFIIGRLYSLLALARSTLLEKNDTSLQYFYDILFIDLDQQPWSHLSVLKIIETSLQNNSQIKQKLKILNNKIKHLLKEHSALSIQILIVLYLAHKQNKIEFQLESYLNDKVFNHKNLQTALALETKKFPQKSPVFKYIILYLRQVQKESDRKNEIWSEFWIFLLKNLSDDHKGFFIILNFLKQFVKLKDFQLKDLQHIMIEELVHLWLKNMSVLNKNLREVSLKIEKNLNKQIEKLSKTHKEDIIVHQFLLLLRARTTFRFSTKFNLGRTLFSYINSEQINEYFKAMKKKLHNSIEQNERLFYLNEIFIIGDARFQNMDDDLFLEICFLIFEETNESKLKQVYSKLPEEKQFEISEERFVEQNKETIVGYFYSLLQTSFKNPSVGFKDKKGLVWKGLCENNDSWIIRILSQIIKKQNVFSQNKELHQTIQDLAQYVEFLNTNQKQIMKALAHSKNKPKQDKNNNGLSIKKQIAFNNLVSGVCIQGLFFPEEALETLEELKIVHTKMTEHYETIETGDNIVKKRKGSDGKQKKIQNNEEEERPFIQVLNDILISQLTKSSTYLRDIVKICFQTFVKELDQFCLETLIGTLTKPNEELLAEMDQEVEEPEDDVDKSEEEEIELEDN